MCYHEFDNKDKLTRKDAAIDSTYPTLAVITRRPFIGFADFSVKVFSEVTQL